ncbi:pilus assembly protein [Shewanella sp. WXL01]|uniref:Pilus assembly protein n=1 Tax=Shewanella maritima TaxID=2520507 RepID=A0A411PGA8_9GAMM|nr:MULTISPECIES: pilus assembly protein [Shewanella]NKF49350.1 pilus assembly protein [Shewanella sp. WXL01]QBF82528.1 pilus assembly protein [Shewanella maritima]
MRKFQSGQGLVEYLIIAALIAVSAIGVYSFFGKTIRNQVAGLSAEVSGQSASGQISQASDAADSADDIADKNYNLGSYDSAANSAASSSGSGSGNSGQPVQD